VGINIQLPRRLSVYVSMIVSSHSAFIYIQYKKGRIGKTFTCLYRMHGIGSKGYRASYLSAMMLWRGKLLHTAMREADISAGCSLPAYSLQYFSIMFINTLLSALCLYVYTVVCEQRSLDRVRSSSITCSLQLTQYALGESLSASQRHRSRTLPMTSHQFKTKRPSVPRCGVKEMDDKKDM